MEIVTLFMMSIFLSVTSVSEWCYNLQECGQSTWNKIGFCNGTEQSPVNINTRETIANCSLGIFSFVGYSDATKLKSITNNGHTVEVELNHGVVLSGGGLAKKYTAIQFHLHWGNGTLHLGSEHTFNGQRSSMELHIVHIREDLSSLTEAKQQKGIAVLGFSINVDKDKSNPAWDTLSNYLQNVSTSGPPLETTFPFSLDDLISQVDKMKYYRYQGSLTTPACDEGVTWTVFETPILVSPSVVNAFPDQVFLNMAADERLANNFRLLQDLNKRQIQASARATHSGSRKGAEAFLVSFLGSVLLCLIY